MLDMVLFLLASGAVVVRLFVLYSQFFLLRIRMFSLYITCVKCIACFSFYKTFWTFKDLGDFLSWPLFYEINVIA